MQTLVFLNFQISKLRTFGIFKFWNFKKLIKLRHFNTTKKTTIQRITFQTIQILTLPNFKISKLNKLQYKHRISKTLKPDKKSTFLSSTLQIKSSTFFCFFGREREISKHQDSRRTPYPFNHAAPNSNRRECAHCCCWGWFWYEENLVCQTQTRSRPMIEFHRWIIIILVDY